MDGKKSSIHLDATLHKIIEIQVFLGKNKEIHNCLGSS
jgi:hypothetical protein